MDYSKIQKLIDSSDIVSFDVFDTLITRQVLPIIQREAVLVPDMS